MRCFRCRSSGYPKAKRASCRFKAASCIILRARRRRSKIKTDKIQQWRAELAPFLTRWNTVPGSKTSLQIYSPSAACSLEKSHRFVSPSNNKIAALRTNEKLALFDHRRAESCAELVQHARKWNRVITPVVQQPWSQPWGPWNVLAQISMDHFGREAVTLTCSLEVMNTPDSLLLSHVRIWQRQQPYAVSIDYLLCVEQQVSNFPTMGQFLCLATSRNTCFRGGSA